MSDFEETAERVLEQCRRQGFLVIGSAPKDRPRPGQWVLTNPGFNVDGIPVVETAVVKSGSAKGRSEPVRETHCVCDVCYAGFLRGDWSKCEKARSKSASEPSGNTGELDEKREEPSHLFDSPRSLDARIAELHLDVLATADEMRAELARQNRAFQTMLTALIVVTSLLALLSLKLIGGDQ